MASFLDLVCNFLLAQNAAQTAISPSLSEKKSLLQKICGVNLSLQNRKVAFTPQNQWASLRDALEKKSETDLCLVLVDILEKSFNSIHDWIMRSYGLIRYFEELEDSANSQTV